MTRVRRIPAIGVICLWWTDRALPIITSILKFGGADNIQLDLDVTQNLTVGIPRHSDQCWDHFPTTTLFVIIPMMLVAGGGNGSQAITILTLLQNPILDYPLFNTHLDLSIHTNELSASGLYPENRTPVGESLYYGFSPLCPSKSPQSTLSWHRNTWYLCQPTRETENSWLTLAWSNVNVS